jgi:hypothetical protein
MLQKSALGIYVNDPSIGGNLAEFIALVCRNWNINPDWIMVSAQREQSTLTKKSEDFPQSARAAWLGFVGQDIGRTSKPGYYGVYTQIERCCEQTAWLLGFEDEKKWPEYVRKAKSTQRFRPGAGVMVEGKKVCPSDAGIYVMLQYTPHMEVLNTNNKIKDSLK